MENIQAGLIREKEYTTQISDNADVIGVSGVPEYSTPRMISLMEEVSFELIEEDLQDETTSIGLEMNVKHVGSVPEGTKIKAICEVLKVQNTKVFFDVKVYVNDESKKLLGTAQHVRRIANKAQFINDMTQLERS